MEYFEFGGSTVQLCFNMQKGFLEEIRYGNKTVKLHSKLWSIQTQDGEIGISDMSGFRFERYADSIKLYWQSDAALVAVTVRCGADEKLRMNIRAEVFGDVVRRVKFPILEGLRFSNDNYLLIPYQNGHLMKNPVDVFLCKGAEVPFWMGEGTGAFSSNYPAGMSFQFSSFYSTSDFGYYLATEDGDAYIKTFTFRYNKALHAMDYILTNYPENMGKTSSYCMPYDFVLKLFDGDWQDAAQVYRTWAIKQKWCKEKLSERKLPKNLIKTDLWRINHMNYALGTRTQEYFDTAKKLRDTLNCNLAQHWYGWNMSRHDMDYPEYIRADRRAEGWPAELRKWTKKFSEEGIVKIPYLNARLCEKKTKTWEEAFPSSVKDENGNLPNEPWCEDEGFELKAMCPTTAMWQNKVEDLCREYVHDAGFDGVYLDQIASFNAALCFDESHPHPLGGGTWWNDAYHVMIQNARDIVGEEGIITTESCCETYIGMFDLFLILDTCFQNTGWNYLSEGGDTVSVPLFSMIYGDYALSYGSNCRFTDRLDRFAYNFIRNLLWGILPCVEGGEMAELEDPSAADKLAVLKKAVDFYKAHKDVFLYGRLCGIPDCACESLQLDWEIEEVGTYVDTFPAICASVWETREGKKLIFAYNYSEKESVIEWNGKRLSVPAKSFCDFAL